MVHGDNLLEILLPGDPPPLSHLWSGCVSAILQKIPSLVGPVWSGVHVKLWLQV